MPVKAAIQRLHPVDSEYLHSLSVIITVRKQMVRLRHLKKAIYFHLFLYLILYIVEKIILRF